MTPPETAPTPPALRLVRAPGARGQPPRPPFGRSQFDPNAAGLAVEVDRDETLASLLERLPTASVLDPGAKVVLLVSGSRGFLAKVLKASAPANRSSRGTALLVRGYCDIEASVDAATGDDLVIGTACSVGAR